MEHKLTHTELRKKGFVQYRVPSIESNEVDELWQKTYKDNEGHKSYFLMAKHYTIIHPTTHEDLGGYELSSQLYLKGSHTAINVTFLNDDIDEAENFINGLFKENFIENYE